ncbi:hypothetical protein Dimus_031803, partial [Dionaea muscipula]
KELHAKMTVIHLKKKDGEVGCMASKNVVPRFGKRDTSSFTGSTYMDLTPMEWRLVRLATENLGVPLVDKKGEEPKRYDYFEETFLTMCKTGLGKNELKGWVLREQRRDDDTDNPYNRQKQTHKDTDQKVLIDEALLRELPGEKFYDVEDKDQSFV